MLKHILSFLPVSVLLFAAPCEIQIQSVQNSVDTYTLVLKHDKKCEMLMDHNASHISLISKR